MIVEIPGLDSMRSVTESPLVDVRLTPGATAVLIDERGRVRVTLMPDDLRYLLSELKRQGVTP